MTEMESKPTELRRSKRISKKIIYDDWSALDFIATDSSSTETKRDELTGRGFVHYMEDITAIEFETLEDMKLYDSVAEKLGNVCCASFNEFSRPFRGFSEEECSSSNNYFLQFKAVTYREYTHLKTVVPLGHTRQLGLQGNSKVPKSIKKSKSKYKKMRSDMTFRGSSTCGPHGKQSCTPCSAAAKSQNNERCKVVHSLLTPAASPNTKFNSSTVRPGDSGLYRNIDDDLLLTPVDSPTSSEREHHPSDKRSPVSNPWDTKPIDFSTIPYMFNCSASHECQSSKACANSSSNFTLCIKLTLGKGRALSKFAIKYLELCKESNTVDRVSATIAASAVDSSTSTVLLPLNKKLISSLFPQSNLIPSMVPHPHLKTVLNGTPNSSINIHRQSEFVKLEKSDSSDLCNNIVSDRHSDRGELLYNLPTSGRKYIATNVTPDPPIKRPLESCPISDDERSHKISKEDSESMNSDVQAMADRNKVSAIESGEAPSYSKPSFDIYASNTRELDDPLSLEYEKTYNETIPRSVRRSFNPRTMLNPSPSESRHLVRSGSIAVTDSLLFKRVPNFKLLPPTEPVQLPQDKLCSSDEFHPQIVSTASLSCIPRAGVSSSTLSSEQSEHKIHNRASKSCPFQSNLRNDIITENNCSDLKGVIDLTTTENDAPLFNASTVHQRGRAEKRKRLSSSSSQLPEEVIVIDDDLNEIENQFEQNGETTKMRRLLSGSSSTQASPVIIQAMHKQKVNSILNSNEKIIDLTEGSGIDGTHNRRQSGLAIQDPVLNLNLIPNSKEKVIDLTEGDEGQTPIEVNVEGKPSNLYAVSRKDKIFDGKREMSAKSVEVPGHGEVIKNYSAKPSVCRQELAVMCTTVPSLGYIRVVRYQTGELILSETFTARVYNHFDDLKALNTYLNQRFEKMSGVKDRGPLEWILATAGVIKLKKVRPINPKVWFHPNDYILTEHGPDNALMVLPLNLPKTKCSPSKTQTSTDSSSKPLPIPQAEARNMRLNYAKSLEDDEHLISVTKCKSATPTNMPVNSGNKPKTARLVSVLLNKEHSQQLVSYDKRRIIINNKATTDQPVTSWSCTKPIKYSNETSAGPQNKKNGVTQPSGQVSADVHSSTQNKPSTTQHMSILLDKHPNIHNLTSTTQTAASQSNNAIQSTESSGTVHSCVHGKSSSSQNIRILTVTEGNELTKHPLTNTLNNNLSNLQPVVTTSSSKYIQVNQIPSNRMQGNIDYKPSTPQIVQTFSLNNDTTSLPTKAQPNLKGTVHWNTIQKSITGQSVVLLSNKQLDQSMNQNIPNNIDKSSLSQTGSFLVNNQPKDNMQRSNQAQVGTSQNVTWLNCQTGQASKVHQYKVSCGNNLSTSYTAQSVAQLLNKDLGQSTNQEFFNNMHSSLLDKSSVTQPMAVVVNSLTNQSTMTHQYKVPSGNTLCTSNNAQPVALFPNQELGQSNIRKSSNNMCSSILDKPSVTQPVILWVNNQRGQSNDKTLRTNLPRPITLTPLLNTQKGQSIKAHNLPSGNVLSTLTSAHSVAMVPGKQTNQHTNLGESTTTTPSVAVLLSNPRSQADQISSSNAQRIILNKPITSQKMAFVSKSQISPPVKLIPIMSTNAEGSSTSTKSTAAQSVTHTKQPPNQMRSTEKTGCPDAMIYFSSEGEYIKGIPVRKLPLVVGKINSKSVVTPKPTASSESSKVISPSTNKQVEFVRKSSLPKVLYSTLDKDQDSIQPTPLKLHWAALNLRKPSLP